MQALRVVAVGRVSTRKKSQETSLQRQRAELDELSARKGWKMVGWFEDKSTGATMLRPGVQEALDLLFRGRADALVVHDLDRLGRDVRELLATVDALAAKGKGLYVRDWEIDATGAHGRMVFTFFAMFAEYFRRLHGDKVRGGLAAAKRRGRLPGRKPKLDYSKTDRAFQMRVEEYSWREIAVELGGTAGAWSKHLQRERAA